MQFTGCKGEFMRRIGRWKSLIVCLMISLALCGCENSEASRIVSEQLSEEEESGGLMQAEESGEDTEEKPEQIFVHVCGQVAAPGVYEMDAGSRVYEAVKAAGGLLDTAAADALNQAERVTDGQKIYVPSAEEFRGQDAAGNLSGSVQSREDGLVNINTAQKEELMTLTGIGEARAEAILKYRADHGNFQAIEDLMNVEGIKEGTYGKIKDKIRI